MRLIDADAFSKQVALMAIKENYPIEKVNAMLKLISIQPVIDPSDMLLNNCDGCTSGEECNHCMRAYSDCYHVS